MALCLSLIYEVDLYVALCPSLICEVDIVWLCALPLSVEVILVGERSCVLTIVIASNSHWRFPCVGSPVWTS